MISRLQWSRVGSTLLILAAAVAVATAVVFTTSFRPTRDVPLSGDASFDGTAPPGDEASADPVADGSPVIRGACDRAGYGTRSSDSPTVSKPKVSTRSVRTCHRNDAGSYEFLADPTWRLREQGSISKLFGPGSDFVVSFGPGPVNGLNHAYDEFVELVGKSYGNVRLGKIDVQYAAADLSIWQHGKGTNAAAEPFEFVAVIIRRPSGGTVGAFGAWNPRTPQVRPLVREVLKSFHAIPVQA